jgi:hypothetical protein
MSQEPKPKRSATEILRVIEESEAADEAERILALSDQELDRELAEAGFDPKEVRERGRALFEKMTRLYGKRGPRLPDEK